MNIPSIKTCIPAIAIALVPISANSQTKVDASANDTVTKTVVLDTLPTDVFEKQASDSTTCNFTEIVKQTDSTQIVDGNKKESTINAATTKIKENTKKFIINPNTTFMVAPIGTYSFDNDLGAFGLKADFKNNKTTIAGDISLGKNAQKSLLVYDISGEYDFDMGKDFYVFPKIEIRGGKFAYNNEEKTNMTLVSPKITAGVKYEKELNNDLTLGGSLEAGGGIVLTSSSGANDYNKSYIFQEVSPEFTASAFAGYKNIIIFVNGGRESGIGYNVQTGVGFKFK